MSRIVIDDDVEPGDPKREARLEFLIREDYRGRCPECSSENIESEARGDDPPKLCWAQCHDCGWQVEVGGHCSMFFESPPWRPDFR